MTDDIVNRLRAAALSGDLALGQSFDCVAVSDEIERLRIAGDALAVAYRTLGGLDVAHDAALRAWEEARRG